MATAHDVAALVLARLGEPVDAYRLQKLTYYAQAWTLVWDGRRLFEEPIEAWANGPVVRRLYAEHRGQYSVARIRGGDVARLHVQEVANIDAVIDYYGRFTGDQLSAMTHQEEPWLSARGELKPQAPSQVVITSASMLRYYTDRQAQGGEGPQRKTYPRMPSNADVAAEVRLQLARWHGTLDRMDER